MHWTVSRRIGAGFALGLGLVLVVAVLGVVALRDASGAYANALAQERRTLVPALGAEAETRRTMLDYLRFLLGREEQYARGRDSSLVVGRGLLEQLRDSARTPESRTV